MFETTYEICSGYVAYMVVIPGSKCNDPNRRMYAAAAYTAAGGSSAAGTAVPVSLSTGSTCCPSALPTSAQPVAGGSSSTPPAAIGGTCAVNVSYHGKDPIPGFTPGRDDIGRGRVRETRDADLRAGDERADPADPAELVRGRSR